MPLKKQKKSDWLLHLVVSRVVRDLWEAAPDTEAVFEIQPPKQSPVLPPPPTQASTVEPSKPGVLYREWRRRLVWDPEGVEHTVYVTRGYRHVGD